MPLYEYYCDDCQKDFTLLQSSQVNKDETQCPDCSGNRVQHNLSTFAPKTKGFSLENKAPVTTKDLPNPNVMNLPIPRLRSEL
jgi:putative FmdB family regulatory protein